MQADTWKAIAHVPWMIKPLYGLITDSLPIWGRRRRPYLVICGLAGARSMPAPIWRPQSLFCQESCDPVASQAVVSAAPPDCLGPLCLR